MKQDELILERKCRAHARAHGWVCCKLEKNGCKGIPDDLFISPDQVAHLVGSFDEFCRVLKIPPSAPSK